MLNLQGIVVKKLFKHLFEVWQALGIMVRYMALKNYEY